jgi:hypothetical protein
MTLKRITAGAFCVALLSACEVTNPGPVQDEFLAEDASQQGLINGAIRRMNELIGNGAYTLALTAREIFPGGQTGASGHDVATQGGEIQEGSFGGYFNDAQQARFIAETAIKRFTQVDAPDNMMYQAHLWAGYAYRYLGDWWCDAVIGSTDPADTEPGSFEAGTDGYYDRAITNFTTALTFASTDAERYAARAGRAQAYLALGQWANAAADAAVVPNTFAFQIQMDDLEQATYNQLYWATATTPYIAYSMVNTFFKSHYDATGDQRARYEANAAFPLANASLSGYGQVDFLNQTKYDDRSDDMNMATGWEMRLIQAEAIIRQTPANHLDALALINQVHTRILSDLTTPASALPALTSTSVAETASHLTRERYLELFLEGKRAPDERRWARFPLPAGTTIDVPDWSGLSNIFVPVASRSLCYDIPTAERDANPNVPAS